MKKQKISFHNHSEYSFDCVTNIFEIIDKAAINNIDVLCITDHDTCKINNNHIDYSNSKNVIIIKGIEFSCKGNIHIIGYHNNIEILEKPRYFYDIKELINRLKKLGAYIYIPHPYHETGLLSIKSNNKYLKDCHAIEIYNNKHPNLNLFFFSNKLKVIADDSHRLNDFPICINQVNGNLEIFNYEDLKKIKTKNLTYIYPLKEILKNIITEFVFKYYRIIKPFLPNFLIIILKRVKKYF